MTESNGYYAPNMRAVPAGEFVKPLRRTNGAGVQAEDTRICVVMVGLPARGKSLIAQKGKTHSLKLAVALGSWD
jgi:6-phosphofructo-2-kinase / fructose-2,6-biphosphatase 2